MFDGVYFCSVHHRFFVRGCHTDIECGDQGIADRVFAGYIYDRLKFLVINSKTCNFLHNKTTSCVMMYSQNRTQKDLGSTWIIALFRNRQCLHLFAESYYNIV